MSRRFSLRPTLVGTLAAGLLALSGCTGLEDTNNGGYVDGDGQTVEIPVEERGEPVALVGQTLAGEPLDVADDRGKVVVVNIWWTGCGPCKREMPMLQEASEELTAEHPDQVAFMGVNTRDLDPANGLAFERALEVGYPSLYDPSGKALLAFHGEVSLFAMPQTVVLDPEGRVAAVTRGEIPTKTTLTSVVEAVIAG
jgi:thiol-disulfide isomerase/thioredoxin